MIPIILLIGGAVLIGMLGLFVTPYVPIAVITISVPVYAWMRAVTRFDDQRLNQLILAMRMRVRMMACRRFWGAVTFTPVAFKRRG